MVRAGALLLPALPLLLAAADLVFRVPTVMVQPISVEKRVGIESVNGSNGSNGTELGVAGGEGEGEGEEEGYEEYFVEHEVSTREARLAAAALRLDDIRARAEGCGECSRGELEYCEARVLADHCCCERRFLPEPFRWLPHTCYVGPRRCRPLAHDCARYARLRDCCCLAHLALRWQAILSRSGRVAAGGASLLLLALLLLAAHL